MHIAYPRGLGPTTETYLSHLTYFYYPLPQVGPPKSRVFFRSYPGPTFSLLGRVSSSSNKTKLYFLPKNNN